MNSDLNIQAPIPSPAETATPASSILGLNFDPSLSSQTNSPLSTSERSTSSTPQVNENLLYRSRNRTSWVWNPENGLPYRTIDANGLVRERWRCARCKFFLFTFF